MLPPDTSAFSSAPIEGGALLPTSDPAESGQEGPKRLKAASFSVSAPVGWASPLLLYLGGEAGRRAAAQSVDFDVVDTSNAATPMVEFIGTSWVGQIPRSESAQHASAEINRPLPRWEVLRNRPHQPEHNALEIIAPTDIDLRRAPRETRFAARQRRHIWSTTPCVLLGHTNRIVYGGYTILLLASQVRQHSVQLPRMGPTTETSIPEPPPPGMVLLPAEAGWWGSARHHRNGSGEGNGELITPASAQP